MQPSIWDCLEGASLIRHKRAMITGAAAGIGKACSHLFAAQGADLILIDCCEKDLMALATDISASTGKDVFPVVSDLTKEDEVKNIFRKIAQTQRLFQILVNNAGGGLPTDLFQITCDEWNKVICLNLTSTFLLSQSSARQFKEQNGGVIINLSSIAGRSTSITAGCHYTSAKAGVLGLTRHMARQLAPFNIRVNAVCPGVINSERIIKRMEERKTMKSVESSIPLGRIGDVDEVAGCCLFLASDLSGYITGASLDVNGGLLML
jgi:NAD(P)-dependent dehydrogenase (short-subunit alcohol dehydrogenase family)